LNRSEVSVSRVVVAEGSVGLRSPSTQAKKILSGKVGPIISFFSWFEIRAGVQYGHFLHNRVICFAACENAKKVCT
jgi:hypothetical protein